MKVKVQIANYNPHAARLSVQQRRLRAGCIQFETLHIDMYRTAVKLSAYSHLRDLRWQREGLTNQLITELIGRDMDQAKPTAILALPRTCFGIKESEPIEEETNPIRSRPRSSSSTAVNTNSRFHRAHDTHRGNPLHSASLDWF